MDVLNTLVNGVVVAVAAGLFAWYAKGRFDALDRRIDRLEERMDRSFDAVHSNLTQVALAVGVQPKAADR
jgi:hypothetical protein